MSIISEALKKAQQKRADDIVDPKDSVREAIKELSRESKTIIVPRKEIPTKNIIIAGGTIVAIFFIMFFVFASFVTRVQNNALVQITSSSTAEKIASTVKKTIVPTTYGISGKIPIITGIVDSFSAKTPKRLPTLNGIMYAASNPKAIIEGKTVSEGDIVQGYTIKHILPYKVTVTTKGKVYDLKLN